MDGHAQTDIHRRTDGRHKRITTSAPPNGGGAEHKTMLVLVLSE